MKQRTKPECKRSQSDPHRFVDNQRKSSSFREKIVYVILLSYIVTLMWISDGSQDSFFSNLIMLIGGYLWGSASDHNKR